MQPKTGLRPQLHSPPFLLFIGLVGRCSELMPTLEEACKRQAARQTDPSAPPADGTLPEQQQQQQQQQHLQLDRIPQPVATGSLFQPGAMVRYPKHIEYGAGKLVACTMRKDQPFWLVRWSQHAAQRNTPIAASNLEPILVEQPVHPTRADQRVQCLAGIHACMAWS